MTSFERLSLKSQSFVVDCSVSASKTSSLHWT